MDPNCYRLFSSFPLEVLQKPINVDVESRFEPKPSTNPLKVSLLCLRLNTIAVRCRCDCKGSDLYQTKPTRSNPMIMQDLWGIKLLSFSHIPPCSGRLFVYTALTMSAIARRTSLYGSVLGLNVQPATGPALNKPFEYCQDPRLHCSALFPVQ